MALTTTTLSAAVAATDREIVVASATGFAVGSMIVVDREVMQVTKAYVAAATTVPVLRGLQGTSRVAHPASTNVTVGVASDFGAHAAGALPGQYPAVPAREVRYYSASGAIELPKPGADMLAILVGTATLTMTIADPTKDLDGSILIVAGNGKSQSTVEAVGDYGNAGANYDLFTFQNAGQVAFPLIAANGKWCVLNAPFTGTSTAFSIGIT